ncbi:unnamed protein product [Blepharisma stoltei]|uniref:Uncharacterized protein n=1 Tax=Blepharisma stoltei TaxID=1481888 RepID=A0AAU9IH03_9CILI|nr:unnamed protein product [Blepharisma stoltei]
MIAPLSSSMVFTHSSENIISIGLNAPLSTGSSSVGTGTLTLFIASSLTGSKCKLSSLSHPFKVTVKPGKIHFDSCTMDKPYTQGPDSVDSTLTLRFTIPNSIPTGGLIMIALAPDTWNLQLSPPFVTTCQGVGFIDQSSTKKQTCTVTSTAVVTLSNFSQIAAGSSVIVKLLHLVPSSPSETLLTCFTSITTFDANGYAIDSIDSDITNSVVVAPSSTVGTTSNNLVI